MPVDIVECGDARITRALHAMLTELAGPLMRAGVTPRLFGDLAARAFVMAACRASTLRNGRINQSRVAVLTGLSRAEVRNVMRGAQGGKRRFQTRTQRVIDGWLSDNRYLVRAGVSRSLPVSGSSISFAALVKEYAGDVPPHAVLEELRRLKLVKDDGARVQLLAPVAQDSRSLRKSLGLLLALLSDGMALSAAQTNGPTRGVHRLTLRVRDKRDSIALYERALTSASSFVNGLDKSLRSAPPRNSKKRGSHVAVSVLVRLREADPNTRRQRNVPTRE